MKKSKIPPVIWILLTALSIFCYVYLHSAAVEEYGSCPPAFSVTNQSMEEGTTKGESKVVLPDIALVKKILNITKIMPSE